MLAARVCLEEVRGRIVVPQMEPYLDESQGLLRLRTSQEHLRTKSAFFFSSELFFCPAVFQVHTLGFIVHLLKRGRIVSWWSERAPLI